MTPMPTKKRARLDDAVAARPAASAASSIADPNGLELLTGALVVTRAFPQIAALPHVASTVSAFLDCCFLFKSLNDAVKTNDLRLLRRLVAASKRRPLPSDRRYPLFLRFHVLDAAKEAAECGFFEALKLLHEVNPHVIDNDDELFAIVAGRGDLETVLWLQESCSLDRESEMEDAMDAAVNSDHLHVLQWIVKNRPAANLSRAMEIAVADGHLEVAKWLSDFVDVDVVVTPGVMGYVAGSGDLEMIEWLDGHARESVEFSPSAFDQAASDGHLDVLQWLYTKRQLAGTYKANLNAAKNGHLEVVKWLHAHFPANLSYLDMDEAAQNGHFDIVQFLHEHCTGNGCTYEAMDGAAKGGYLEIVRFLHEHYGDVGGCSPEAMDAAAANGHFEIVRFLHEHRTEGCTTDAMDRAAKNGHLEIVQFLHTHRQEGCTSKAMNKAAKNGHLDVVQFLHTHREEGCTTYAMDCAAANGFLEMVEWLHAHRSEGCTTAAMDNAAARGHLEIVQFLHVDRSEGCTTRAMDHAARFGNLEVVQWLHEHRTEGCTTAAMDYAASAQLDVVQWLHANRSEGCARAAMDQATSTRHLKMMGFLLDNRPESFSGALPTDDIASLHWFYENHRDKCDVREIRESAEAYDRDDILEWLEDVGELQPLEEMAGGYDREDGDAAARVHPPTSVAASEELVGKLETAVLHFSAAGCDALRNELLSDASDKQRPSSSSLQELTRLLTQLSQQQQQQQVALSAELFRSVVAVAKTLCKTATAYTSSVASSANEEVAGFLALDDNLAPIFEFLAALTELMHSRKPSTQAAAVTEQLQSESAAAYEPKELLRWVPFVLHACAHIACEQLPAAESMRVFPVSQRILSHCEGITNTHSQSELFAKYIDQLVALCSQASASKEEWVASRSFHKHVLRFVALQVPFPHLGGDLLGRLLALVFPLIDDLSDATQLVGAQILQHVVHNVTATELRWYADVLLEVLRLAITSRKPETLDALLDCLATSLDKLSPASEFAHYDKFFPRLLNDTSLCSEVTIRAIFLRRLRPMIERMGAPHSIHVVRYLQPLLKVLVASFEGINIALLLETLETLRVTILSAWPRVPAHTEEIFVGVMRAVAFCDVFDAGGGGGALQSLVPEEKEQILERCEYIFVLLHDLGAVKSADEDTELEAQGQQETQVLKMLHEVSSSCVPLKPFCERMTAKLHATT